MDRIAHVVVFSVGCRDIIEFEGVVKGGGREENEGENPTAHHGKEELDGTPIDSTSTRASEDSFSSSSSSSSLLFASSLVLLFVVSLDAADNIKGRRRAREGESTD